MLATERRAARSRKTIVIAATISLVLHALVLFLPLHRESLLGGGDASPYRVYAPLEARLAKRSQAPTQGRATSAPVRSKQSASAPAQRDKSKVLSSNNGNWRTQHTPSEAPAPKVSGYELAQRALAMVRNGMVGKEDEGGVDAYSTRQQGKGQEIEPRSLEWYFDSFITKLNNSARFVPHAPPSKGQRAAEVEIIINRDGSLREYRVVRAADRQIEVAYIRSVVDRAAPFAAFPPDISQKTDTLSLTICIQPPGDPDGGFGFTRTNGRHC